MSLGLESLGLVSLGLSAETSGAAPDPTIVDITATDTTATVTYSGSPSHYRLDGGSAVAIGASPYTITGLTANTEYTLEIGDGATWVDSLDFGTENAGSMGSGGGGGGGGGGSGSDPSISGPLTAALSKPLTEVL